MTDLERALELARGIASTQLRCLDSNFKGSQRGPESTEHVLAHALLSLSSQMPTAEEREALKSLRFMISKYWANGDEGEWLGVATDALDRILAGTVR